VDGLGCDIPVDVIPADKRPRIGRLDRLCRLFLSASYLAARDLPGAFDGEAGERVGLSFGTGLGCLLTNAEYYEKVIEHGPAAASPRLFAYTVSSAAAGEVSIALGIKGPNVTQHMGFAAGLGALGYGCDLIAMGKADEIVDAWRLLEEVRVRINETWARRASMTPSHEMRSRPPVLEIYKRLPRTNCKLCGEQTCLAFAAKLRMGEGKLSQCTPVFDGKYKHLRAALVEVCAPLGVAQNAD
jgi:hypothetical protein